MVVTIAKALDLPMPAKYIRIEDVAKPEDMLKASEARHKEGKHVIPVPTMELKPYFKGYMVDPPLPEKQEKGAEAVQRME